MLLNWGVGATGTREEPTTTGKHEDGVSSCGKHDCGDRAVKKKYRVSSSFARLDEEDLDAINDGHKQLLGGLCTRGSRLLSIACEVVALMGLICFALHVAREGRQATDRASGPQNMAIEAAAIFSPGVPPRIPPLTRPRVPPPRLASPSPRPPASLAQPPFCSPNLPTSPCAPSKLPPMPPPIPPTTLPPMPPTAPPTTPPPGPPSILGATAFACKAITGATRLLHDVEKLCSQLSTLRFILNSYDTENCPPAVLDILPGCATLTHVPGMKGLFWKRQLTNDATLPFNFVWVFDSDLAIGAFDITSALETMLLADVSAAQPLIWAQSHLGRRCSDVNFLNADAPLRDGCRAEEVLFIEVMVPIFRQDSWSYLHQHLIGELPDSFLYRADTLIDAVWCTMLERAFPNRTACALLSLEMEHLDTHSIEKQHGAVIRGWEDLEDTGRRELEDAFLPSQPPPSPPPPPLPSQSPPFLPRYLRQSLASLPFQPPSAPSPLPPAACEWWCEENESKWSVKCKWPSTSCSSCVKCFRTEVATRFPTYYRPSWSCGWGRRECLLYGGHQPRPTKRSCLST